MKYISLLLLTLSLTSCGVFKKKGTTVDTANVEVSSKMRVSDLQKQLEVPEQWKTLRIRANAEYKDEKIDQSIGVEIRIKKNEVILVSAKLGPITVAKALITPQRVSYYERANSTYFDGDFSMLSKWLGTELNYAKVEALLLGQVDWDKANTGELITSNKQWQAIWKENASTQGSYIWNALTAVLVQQKYSQAQRTMEVNFSQHAKFDSWVFPQEVQIQAQHPQGKNRIALSYNQLVVNPELTFPYEVPSGFERVTLDSQK